MNMTLERAIEILDPEHREHYDSIEPVITACRMGMDALRKQIPTEPDLKSRCKIQSIEIQVQNQN